MVDYGTQDAELRVLWRNLITAALFSVVITPLLRITRTTTYSINV